MYTSTILQVRPRSLVLYPFFASDNGKAGIRKYHKHVITKERNNTKGKLSPGSIRRLRYAVQLLEEVSPWQSVINPSTQTPYRYKLGFLTLTLPCQQGSISDADIKRKCLMPYLTALQKKFGRFSYVWKAEAQENGNIHFHITLNKWIPYSHLRHYWNRSLSHLGFIEEYKRHQEAFHSQGFTPRPELFKNWPLEAQKKAHEFGVRSNWTEPNSTDIHAVHKIRNLSAYIIKYMSKAEAEKRPIEGKIWGCSENLTYTHKFEEHAEGVILTSNKSLEQVFPTIHATDTFVTILQHNKPIAAYEFSSAFKLKYSEWLSDIYLFKKEIIRV